MRITVTKDEDGVSWVRIMDYITDRSSFDFLLKTVKEVIIMDDRDK